MPTFNVKTSNWERGDQERGSSTIVAERFELTGMGDSSVFFYDADDKIVGYFNGVTSVVLAEGPTENNTQ